ncbi:MAG: S8 family peptidase [Armatimonadetes bacterium]|nr:S8 family peptidase [Armatimonadota bacterium]
MENLKSLGKLILILALIIFIANCGSNPNVNPSNTLSDNSSLISDINSKTDNQGTNLTRKIIVFKEGTKLNQINNIISKEKANLIKHLHLINAAAITLPLQSNLQNFLRYSEVIRVDDDLVVASGPKGSTTTQPAQSIPWGINRINAPLSWDISQGNAVKVAILDTGIDLSHPDLQTNLKGGINTINPHKSYKDDNGHGTHVAGIVAAINNTIGVVGVGPQIYLYAVKALGANGSGWLSDIIEGFAWCIDNQIKVVNMSFGSSTGNQSFQDAILKTYNAGITLVAAAGNESGAVSYPAKYSECIAVSASKEDDQFADFSNYGPEVDLIAPGVNITSTYKGGIYAILSGTSMAAPHITGCAALKIFQNPGLTPQSVETTLKLSASPLPGLTIEQQGSGMVDTLKLTSIL